MKKNRRIISIAILLCLLVSLFAFTACVKPDNTYTTTKLTKENIFDYLIASFVIDSIDAEYINTNSLGNDLYRVFYVGQVVTRKLGNFKFEDTYITVSVESAGDWKFILEKQGFYIDYEGNGKYSICFDRLMLATSPTNANITTSDYLVRIVEVKGQVREYE